MALGLKAGEWVRIRNAAEILSTLDADGMIDGMPFMPEMLRYCGQRGRVYKRADKACDTIRYEGNRRMFDTVHLEGLRCDGTAHGGCQARCLLYFKEAWLERADGLQQCDGAVDSPSSAIPEALQRGTWMNPGETGQDARYRCQATELLRASHPMRWWDVRQYGRDVVSGNVGLLQLVRAALFRLFRQTLRIGAFRAQVAAYNHVQTWRGGVPYPFFDGHLDKAPRESLGLQPGEWVRVKSREEILKTIDKRNRNRGLSFDVEMVRYCGTRQRVLGRVERLIEESTGRMIQITSDCVILEGAYCHGEYSHKRLFCPRAIFSFWREIWLERVAPPDASTAPERP